MRTQRISFLALGCASLVIAAACGRKAGAGENAGGRNTIAVQTIDLGRGINADLTIKDQTTTFKPSDVVYASIQTEGAAPATLGVRWIYNDSQVVDEGTREIHPTGDTRTEFHISKPDGFPEGHYRLEVTLNGASAGTKEFDVKR
ncbi:MAG TPA: hypothetical protein VFM23_05000 [Gemmatimonadales bacterium]|nr:hypothetical protein [Gemmatimonadales bacterium]